jgi:hypothetical protein
MESLCRLLLGEVALLGERRVGDETAMELWKGGAYRAGKASRQLRTAARGTSKAPTPAPPRRQRPSLTP